MHSRSMEQYGRSEGQIKPRPQRANPQIRDYYAPRTRSSAQPSWMFQPEIPTASEILDVATDGSSSSEVVEISPNRPEGAWATKNEYLATQYELMREDAVRPLREAVAAIRSTPGAAEDHFNGKVGIYEKVHICGITLSTRGIAVRITFSLFRTGKKIRWEQSKRLISGSVVALTPTDDMFQSKAVIAVVAARPLVELEQNPPQIDLFFPCTDGLEIDPEIEWIMVEHRSAYYEASRHTLLALQKMACETFPLAEHLVEVQKDIEAPQCVKNNPNIDLSAAFTHNTHGTYDNINILHDWPVESNCTLDPSQLKALQRILTKRLAIVQGPPGTGKTYVSVQAIKILLANRAINDPPILVASQTNHASDQILRHVANFEPQFARLGGRSKDKEVIKSRTLYELRQEANEPTPTGSLLNPARAAMSAMHMEFEELLTPLKPSNETIDHRLLEQLGLLSQEQADSLQDGASRWVRSTRVQSRAAATPFALWLGDKLVPVPVRQLPEDFGFEFEEGDLGFELLKDMETEDSTKEEDDVGYLRGPYLSVADNFTCAKVLGRQASPLELLKQQDMWKIPVTHRGAIYRYLQAEMKKMIVAALREKAKRFDSHAFQRRIGSLEWDEKLLLKQKIIGMTTTGFSKYRALISALRPRIVLIEEAAETLEAAITAACLESIHQLILVGDHQQLQPHTQCPAHEGAPYHLNISLFERLINNGIEFSTLNEQRRMIPEVRRLLYPIYEILIKDHPSVTNLENRPNVPGMGGINSFFMTHEWSEQRDDLMSCFNPKEADMLLGFVEYLYYQGVELDKITILTFYNGQRRHILAKLREYTCLTRSSKKLKIATVDSYQGEENQVVILSLVRSNKKNDIGFLRIDNRVCVALSRAQCGFYIFGNGMLLHGNHKTWQTVIEIMAGQKNMHERPKASPNRLAIHLPVRCQNHGTVTFIKQPEDWDGLSGGCRLRCTGLFPCGHPCKLNCHPYAHEDVDCPECAESEMAKHDQSTERQLIPKHDQAANCHQLQKSDQNSKRTSTKTLVDRSRSNNSAASEESLRPNVVLTATPDEEQEDLIDFSE